jgi:uncharacterized protein involved in exopolysaccharide biosynthesis
MDEHILQSGNGNGNGSAHPVPLDVQLKHSTTARDLVAVLYRRKRLIWKSFAWMMVGVLLVAVFYFARTYDVEMKIIVNNYRADPYVSSGQTQTLLQTTQLSDASVEGEMNTEVELLKSKDFLAKVVIDSGLDKEKTLGEYLPWTSMEYNTHVARIASGLSLHIKTEYVKKSHLIKITYGTTKPVLGQHVVASMAKVYLAEHLATHRPEGTFDFFSQETDRTRKELMNAEAQLAKFTQETDEASPAVARDIAVQKLADFDATYHTAQVNVAQIQERIADDQRQLDGMPGRILTQESVSDSWSAVSNARTQLLNLEIQRTALLTKYNDDYPLVKQLDTQIAQAQDELHVAETSPTKAKTTDNDPTVLSLQADLAKSKADLAGYQGQVIADATVVSQYRDQAVKLGLTALQEDDLQRLQKSDAENVNLYVKKMEEARIDDALDRLRIMSVGIAQYPVVPRLPFFSPFLFTLIGAACAALLAVIFAYVADYYDPSLRIPENVTEDLMIPVYASIPKNAN